MITRALSDQGWPRSGNPHHHARDVASVSGQQTPGSRWRGNPGLRMDTQRSDKPDGSSPRARPFRPRPAAEKGERRKWRGEFLGDVGGAAGPPNLEYGAFRRFPMRWESGVDWRAQAPTRHDLRWHFAHPRQFPQGPAPRNS